MKQDRIINRGVMIVEIPIRFVFMIMGGWGDSIKQWKKEWNYY